MTTPTEEGREPTEARDNLALQLRRHANEADENGAVELALDLREAASVLHTQEERPTEGPTAWKCCCCGAFYSHGDHCPTEGCPDNSADGAALDDLIEAANLRTPTEEGREATEARGDLIYASAVETLRGDLIDIAGPGGLDTLKVEASAVVKKLDYALSDRPAPTEGPASKPTHDADCGVSVVGGDNCSCDTRKDTDPLIELAEELEARAVVAEKHIGFKPNDPLYTVDDMLRETALHLRESAQLARDYASRNPAQPDPEDVERVEWHISKLRFDADQKHATDEQAERKRADADVLARLLALATTGEVDADRG